MGKGILTKKEMKTQMKENNGIVSGVISIPFNEIAGTDYEAFLDSISERLTGSACLAGTCYKVVGCNAVTQEVLLEVTGDASACLD